MSRLINPFKSFKRYLLNIPGWRTSRKIVIFESDDWGSIRMPSKEVFDELKYLGIKVDNLSFNQYDSLASEEDLMRLFEVLSSVKDKNGNPAVLTANTIVANPDFEKIRASNFAEYYYEPFTSTLNRYPAHAKSFTLWKEGISRGIFKPQFHGREHLNVARWMRALQNDSGLARRAFNFEMFDLSESLEISEKSFMDTYNFQSENELLIQIQSIKEGLELFEQLFGYKSITFIAPCNIWSNKLNQALYDMGVNTLKTGWIQLEPKPGSENKFRKIFHYIGQRNNLGQRYLPRNAHFEPSQNPSFDYKNDILSRAEIAFHCGKPLIIGTHRLNFIGFIDKLNREQNLLLLSELLKELIKTWPDVEFMSADELAKLMSKNKN
jgi:hypothetical protein